MLIPSWRHWQNEVAHSDDASRAPYIYHGGLWDKKQQNWSGKTQCPLRQGVVTVAQSMGASILQFKNKPVGLDTSSFELSKPDAFHTTISSIICLVGVVYVDVMEFTYNVTTLVHWLVDRNVVQLSFSVMFSNVNVSMCRLFLQISRNESYLCRVH